jgi:hypothetical protein
MTPLGVVMRASERLNELNTSEALRVVGNAVPRCMIYRIVL